MSHTVQEAQVAAEAYHQACGGGNFVSHAGCNAASAGQADPGRRSVFQFPVGGNAIRRLDPGPANVPTLSVASSSAFSPCVKRAVRTVGGIGPQAMLLIARAESIPKPCRSPLHFVPGQLFVRRLIVVPRRVGFVATLVRVTAPAQRRRRHLPEIEQIGHGGSLDEPVAEGLWPCFGGWPGRKRAARPTNRAGPFP